LRSAAEELVPFTQKLLEVPAELIATALDLELQDGTVIADGLDDRRCVFLAGLYRAERENRRKAEGAGRWKAALAVNSFQQGDPLGREAKDARQPPRSGESAAASKRRRACR
jgi:hypothetical protein